MTTEVPGGTVGCDVCGILLAADKVAAHRAWHHTQEERLDRLSRSMDELLDRLPGTHAAADPGAAIEDAGRDRA